MSTSPFTFALDALANLGGPAIPDVDTADPRFPFTFLVDTSFSTGMIENGVADIDKINDALGHLIRKLKYPQPGSPLAQVHDQIDLMLIAYASAPTVVVDWCKAPDLPDQLPIFQASGGTAMGAALDMALDKTLARQRRYKEQGLPRCGLPHIFNLTDGSPTDVQIGDLLWTTIEQKLAKAASDPAKKSLVCRHLIAPNGYSGAGAGANKISQWFGANAIVPLDQGSDNFSNMIELVVKSITTLSQPGADPETALKVLASKGVSRAA